jgi:hypothetical protein
MLVLGEVLTSLLPTSSALPADVGARLLALTAGAQVLRSDRPMPYVVSPERLTGVDCQVPTGTHRTARAIGTVTTRALLVGGHILQSSARTVAVRGTQTRRLPWSYYLARPSTVEIVGKYRERDAAEAFLAATPASPLLNLGAIAGHTAERVRASPIIDYRVPFRSGRTTLRWIAQLTGEDNTGPDEVTFTVEGEGRRTVRLRAHGDALADVVALCEDLALHDWLLTTLTGMVARAPLSGPKAPAAIDRIRPAIDHLLHLWMPGARLGTGTRRFWDQLEQHAGFGRQWTATVQRIRDQLALNTLRELGRLAGPAAS